MSSFRLEVPARGAALLEVAVVEFVPPQGGPSEAVVTLASAKGSHEVGRFSLFPDEPFKVAPGGQPRRFNMRIPKEATGTPGETVTLSVRLAPTTGANKVDGGKLVVQDVRFRPDP